VRCTTTNSRWWQLWKAEGGFIVNEKGKVLSVQNQNLETDAEQRNIQVENRGKDLR